MIVGFTSLITKAYVCLCIISDGQGDFYPAPGYQTYGDFYPGQGEPGFPGLQGPQGTPPLEGMHPGGMYRYLLSSL